MRLETSKNACKVGLLLVMAFVVGVVNSDRGDEHQRAKNPGKAPTGDPKNLKSRLVKVTAFSGDTNFCIKIRSIKSILPQKEQSSFITDFSISLKVLNDGFNSEKYALMEKEKLQKLAQERPSVDFDILISSAKAQKNNPELSCSQRVSSSYLSHNVKFPLLANSGLSATLTHFPNGPSNNLQEMAIFVCNCDRSFNLHALRTVLGDEKYGAAQGKEPTLLYDIEVKKVKKYESISKKIPILIIVHIYMIFFVCKKLYSFSIAPNTTLNTQQDPFLYWVLGG